MFGNQGFGLNKTQLNYRWGLHFDLFSNSLIIVNHLGSNVVRYVFNDKNGWTLLCGSSNGIAGSTSTLLIGPTIAILDPMGNIYVADRNNQRILFFSPDQFNSTTIVGGYGSKSDQLYWPTSVRLDNQLNLYVADTNNHRIQMFLRY